MSGRTASWLAWSLAALSVAMFLFSFALTVLSLYAGPTTQPPSDWGTAGPLSSLLIFSPFLAFPVVGGLIASRRPENPIGWICIVAGLFWMYIILADASDAYELARTGAGTSSVTLDALLGWLWVPPVGLLGIYLILLCSRTGGCLRGGGALSPGSQGRRWFWLAWRSPPA